MRPIVSRSALCCLAFLFLVLWPRLGSAFDGLIEKKVFTLPSFATVAGDVLKDVRFGFETSLLEIARRNEIRRGAKLLLLSIPILLRGKMRLVAGSEK